MIDDHSSSSDIIFDCVASAARLGWQCLPLVNGVPLIVKRGGNMLSMLSGVHGDERSGPVFLTELLQRYVANPTLIPQRGMIIVPLLNDEGWDIKHRLWGGSDLNRQFVTATSVKHVRELMDVLSFSRPMVHWDLHEDDERLENYVYGYSAQKPNLAMSVCHVLGCPFEPSEKPSTNPLDDMSGSSEEFMYRFGTASLTSEANPSLPLNDRLVWLNSIYDLISRW